MNDNVTKPALSLGEPPARLANRYADRSRVWIGLVVVLQVATLGAVGYRLLQPTANFSIAADGTSIETIRATAAALEDRSLPLEAARVWRNYLRINPGADDRAEVLYRIGGLMIDAEQFSEAATALVEAEQLANDDLKSKIGPKIVLCLRRLGKYGEVGRELSRQVEVDGEETGQGDVLATFAGEEFTQADLDRMLERTIDRVLAMSAGQGFAPTREQLLKQYAAPAARQRMLQEILQRELFSRRARELELDRETEFQQSREFLETELLASRFLARELEKIQSTDVDIESYYQAHAAEYRQPESASVMVLPIGADQTADDVLTNIKSADDFRKLANEAHGTTKTDAATTPIRVIRGQPHPQYGDLSAVFDLAVGEWTHSAISGSNGELLALVEAKTPATTPTLEQIRFRVEADYRQRKQQELSQRLFDDLTRRYNVQILPQPTAGHAAGNKAESSTTPDNETKPAADSKSDNAGGRADDSRSQAGDDN